MCDYSMEHLMSVKATEGEKYKIDGSLAHGFLTRDSNPFHLVAACVVPGQRLRLTRIVMHPHCAPIMLPMPDSMTVTVVQRSQDPARFRSFGHFNDGIELEDGRAFPLLYLWHADMEVLPVEQPKPKRSLAAMLGLDKKDEAVLDEIEQLTRDKVDAD